MNFHHGQDAIQIFQQKMRALKSSRLYWCVLVVEWKQPQSAPWVHDARLAEQLNQLLTDSLAQEEGKTMMLVLPSGDILILCEAVTNAAYKRLKLALESLVTDMVSDPLPCRGYDLSVDWEAFVETCRDIYGRLNQMEGQAKKINKSGLLQQLENEFKNAGSALASRAVKPKTLNLLFVEDEPTIRQLLNNLLAESKHNLSFASTGEEAVQAYIRKPPHLVFLDINLPDISGLEVLELISKHDSRAHAVMLTSDAGQAQVQTAVQQGVKGYIVKPFSRQKLTECIDRYYSA